MIQEFPSASNVVIEMVPCCDEQCAVSLLTSSKMAFLVTF